MPKLHYSGVPKILHQDPSRLCMLGKLGPSVQHNLFESGKPCPKILKFEGSWTLRSTVTSKE